MVRQLVQLDERGFIVIDDQNQSSLPGMFAAGDVANAICEQIMIAIGAGARRAERVRVYPKRLGLESRSVGTP
jgi:thioredoxin reductase (NADPH)